jgi:hypothetical protein
MVTCFKWPTKILFEKREVFFEKLIKIINRRSVLAGKPFGIAHFESLVISKMNLDKFKQG